MEHSVARVGYTLSLVAFFATLGYSITQIMQVAGLIRHPYDDIFIYSFSLCISLPFLISTVSVYHIIARSRKVWAHIAIMFSGLYTFFAITVYTVQLAIVLPHTHGTASSDLLTITPHSFFWTLDALAYLNMGIATAFLIPALRYQSDTYLLRIFLFAHALLTPVIGFVYFYPHFSIPLLFLGSPWIISACGSLWLLALYFKRHIVEPVRR